MEDLQEQSDTQTILDLGGKRYILIGTAHISQESVQEVGRVIRELRPERVCVELDEGRYAALTQHEAWKKLDIFKVLRQGKGYLLLVNLILSGFQKRMGLDTGVKPGEEMREAIRLCDELGLPFSLIDRDIQITFRRAWGTSKFWTKIKLLSTLVGSAFSNEEFDKTEIENLKKKSALEGMMEGLSTYLPSVKAVLIDERDEFMARQLFAQKENQVLAVVGAGHVPGLERWLKALHGGTASSSNETISQVPKPSVWPKILAWVFPALLFGLVGYAFVTSGWHDGAAKLLSWMITHGIFVAVGTALAFGHPLTIVLGAILSPLGTLHILGSVGLVSASIEAMVRKPRISDLENLQTEAGSFLGFYKNRVTRTLLVFFLSSLGGAIGNWVSLPGIIFK